MIVVPLIACLNLECPPFHWKKPEVCLLETLEITSPNETITSVDDSPQPTSFQQLGFTGRKVHFLPKNIGKFFPKLKSLRVDHQGLKSIQGADLEGLFNLEILSLVGNEIVELSSDLSKFTPKLMQIRFSDNKIC